jgi:hypothetical protein
VAFVEHFGADFADFGQAVVVAGVDLFGIFDDAYQDALGLVAGSQPALLLPTSDVGLAGVGDSVTVAGASYTIAAVQPDGVGITRLLLK